ncbi:MAG TPA: serine hydrolase domain-containing protein [Thermoanaerobaculia bacterium]|nr:serine hydrolase domain-containing protein [Thermoanaerobaculia bacterium]
MFDLRYPLAAGLVLLFVVAPWAHALGSSGAAPASAAAAEPALQLPDTAAGRRAAALVAALRAAGEEQLQRFFSENYAASAVAERSAAVRAAAMRQVLADLGHGELASVEAVGERTIELVFKAESRPLWIHFALELEPAPPYAILGMRIRAEDQPPERAASGLALTEEAALAAIAAEAEKRAAAGEFSGVVLVARAGRALLTRALGIAERSFGTPVRGDTRFNLGSINKLFTQVVIQQLAGEGKLDPADRLSRLLPDYPNRAVAEKVSIQQLLDHASGLGDIFGERYAATPKSRLRTLADYLPLFADQPLLFEPGSQQRYSNAGYVVLGLVIERLTGKSYYEAVRERILERAGMGETGSYEVDDPVANRAAGYTREGEGGAGEAKSSPLRSNVYTLPARGSSAGGGYSTAADLLRFAGALRAGRLLKPDRWQRNGGIAVAGGSPGCNAVLEDDWLTGYTVIVLSNLDPPSAETLARAVRALLARVAAGR